MKWNITYYNDKVFKVIQKLPMKLRARFIALTDVMADRGPSLGMPHTKAMGDDLFELRIKAKEGIARVFYCVQIKNEIIMLHCFIKKTQKTPEKELKIARKHCQEVRKNG